MRDLAIVSSCSGYGIYLRDWAKSIANLTTKPGEVVLVIHGSAADEEHAPGVRDILAAAGIPHRVHCVTERMDFGAARNLAVSLSTAPWVMHFDCDDMLLPHAVDDIAAIAPTADVVSLGYERGGDLKSGPANPRRLYSTLNGLEALDATAPASGVSPFRRELWEKSPYRLGMKGAWDTALWIGFARLGARFRPTTRPAFIYRQHGDSVFNRRRLTFDWTRSHVQAELAGLRRPYAGVDVVIPHRPDGGPRDRSLAFTREHYAAQHPEWGVAVGTDNPAGRWSKGDAIRDALTRSSAAVIVIADGDCMVDAMALRGAVRLVETGAAPWAIPHRMVHRLSEPASLAWMARARAASHRLDVGDTFAASDIESEDRIRKPYVGFAGGGFIVVRRDRWDAMGGIPREFSAWGCEDEAVALILDTLLGPAVRGEADLVHLWHPPGERTKAPTYYANRQRLAKYRAAIGSADRMWELVDPRRTPATVTGSRRQATATKNARQANAEPVRNTMPQTIAIRAEQDRRNALQYLENQAQRRQVDEARAKARDRRIAAERQDHTDKANRPGA